MMGIPPSLCRGRMPVFAYLSEDEARDVYLYLTLHPPGESATTLASVTSNPPPPPDGASLSNHLPVAPDRDNAQPVSLAKFAIFPAVLFVFLGGVVMKCLPMAAKAHHTNEIECGACTAAGDCRVTATAAFSRERQVPSTVREPFDPHHVAGRGSVVRVFETAKRY